MSYYIELSKQVMNEDQEIREFRDTLETKYGNARNICLFKSPLYKACHLVKTVKARIDYRRLGKIREEFNNFLDDGVCTYIKEESGCLQTDLENAARIFKPAEGRKKVKQYSSIVNKR